MNIRLDGSDRSQSQLGTVNPTDAGTRVETTAVAASAGSERESSDEADISGIADLVAKGMDEPQVRMEKVAAIKAQIEAGTYKVDAEKVADAVIDSALKGEN